MAARVLPRTEFGNTILARASKRVSKTYLQSSECKELVRNMVRTMRATKGVGLAAPQVGVPLRISVIEVRPTPERPDAAAIPLRVVINPRIVAYHGKQTPKWEGCLSFMKVFGKVPRYTKVTVEYQTLERELVTETAGGLLGHIFQHEIDHLDGIRFIDRLKDPSTLVTAAEYRRMRAR